MLGVGIVGLGMMGRMHYNGWSKMDGVEVRAIADTDEKRARGDLSSGWSNLPGAEGNQLPMDRIQGFTDAGELNALDEIDIVDVCVPTPAHAEVSIPALEAGKHVMCEKPLALTVVEARRIAEAADAAKGMFMPAMCMRFWPEWVWLRQAIRERHYGGVRAALFRRLGNMPGGWYRDGKQSGGAITDLHVHDTDFVVFAFGLPGAVFSRGVSAFSGAVDHGVTQYLYDDAAPITAEGSFAPAPGYRFQMHFEVLFEEATAIFHNGGDPTLTLIKDGEKKPPPIEQAQAHHVELQYFARCVREGNPPQVTNAAEAIKGLRVIEAERQSIASGQVVEV